jgi:AAA+ ATPase superfamily predicted ATPase
MFVGREAELHSLEKSHKQRGFRFAVLYGRRRVGKTTLINEFCKGKKAIYFVAVESTAKENLEILSAQILSVLAPGAPHNPFATFREAVAYVFEFAKNERVILAIDEYPYLAESDRSVSSVLQSAIDKYHEASNLFLILCGSAMSFMENQVLGYKSPLYGRRTSQYRIQAFDYLQCADMLPGFSAEDKIVLYGVTGGIPAYVSGIDGSLSVKENVRELFFDPSGRLFEEPSNLLKQELKMPATYNGMIAAIAGGAGKLNEIATKAGIETSQCSKMLLTLMSLGIVKKEYPITAEHSKKTIYALNDQMFRFWYRFVLPDLSRIESGLGGRVCDEVFAGQISAHIGYAFEECAKQYLWRALRRDRLPVSFKKIGRWWGANRAEKREEEIDIVAFADDSAIFGECKWRNAPAGEDVLNALIEKSSLLPQFQNRRYMLFSKSGYTGALSERARNDARVQLVCVRDMF